MEGEQTVETHIADAVAVREHERAAANQRPQLLEPATGQRRIARIHQVHAPRLDVVVIERSDITISKRYGHVAAERAIIEKISLDLIAFVPQRQHELVEAVLRVVLHDVPDNGPAADLHERL